MVVSAVVCVFHSSLANLVPKDVLELRFDERLFIAICIVGVTTEMVDQY